ncbi:MAG: hypothetical protein O2838_06205, partial [Proteobacteria bacterium]|nr:hypothetical protein [Pseudomonadota bacterium]
MKLMIKAFLNHRAPKGPISLLGLLMIAVACAGCFAPLGYALAQLNQFSASIIVNDRTISYYDI